MRQGPKSKTVYKIAEYNSRSYKGGDFDAYCVKLNQHLDLTDEMAFEEKEHYILMVRYVVKVQAWWRGFLIRKAMKNMNWEPIAKFNTNVD